MRRIEAPRANVLGVGVSAINMEHALSLLESAITSGKKGYICVTGVHGIMEAQRDTAFRKILNDSLLTTPDGMPTVWVGKVQGFRCMERVYGPDFMLKVCELSRQRGYTQFFYGGMPGVAEQLKSVLTSGFPGLRVVGTYCPPFRTLNGKEETELRELVSSTRPDIFWVGLSTPKQERFMAEYIHKLDTTVMVGVGAAFNVHVGLMRDSPDWLKKAGLQWFHRLLQEPSRLWKRYLINNPLFLWKIALQLSSLKKYPI